MNKFTKNNIYFLSFIVFFTICDLWSKDFIFNFIDKKSNFTADFIYYHYEILSFFNLVKVLNHGVSFGLFSDLTNGKYYILIINIIIIIILFYLLFIEKKIYIKYCYSLIISGACGNSIDRIINGAVADFLDFHIYGYHWPAFNLADILIFIGVFLLLTESLFIKNNK